MVAVVTGAGLGLASGSAAVLGDAGRLGEASTGRGGEAVYVNATTGALVVQHEDELLVGRGPDIGVVRTYNSNATFDFDNNDSWQLSLYRKIGNLTGTLNTAGSTVIRTGADGARLTYSYDAALGSYINKEGSGTYDTLAYNSTSKLWTWTDGDSQIKETYAASLTAGEWRITGLVDLDANALSYTYDANGLITQITDANGEITKLTYDGAKRLQNIQVLTSGGVTTTRIRYTYDSAGRLASVVTDLTPADGSISDSKVYTTSYTYDGSSKRIASIVNSDGTRVSFTYDANGRVKTVVDGAGQVSSFAYGSGNTTVTDPLGRVSTLTYDVAGNLTRLQGPTGSAQDIRYAYNANGDLIQLTDSRGGTTVSSYDSNGNLLRQQDAAGNVVEYSYNTAKQLVKKTVYAAPDPDGSGTAQAGGAQVTHYVRDAKQHVRFTVSPEGRISEYRYNASGQTVSVLVYSANAFTVSATSPVEADLVAWVATQDKTRLQRTDTVYDARGQITSVTRYSRTDAAGFGVADGNEATARYVYDSAGRLLQQIDPRGVATTGVANDYLTAYAYDGLGRTISVTSRDAAGNDTRRSSTVFNDALNRIEFTLANGLKRVSTYDGRGLLSSQVEQDGASTLSTQLYQYDAAGRLRVVVDPNGNKTYTIYDSANRVAATVNATGSLTEYFYNASGSVIKSRTYAIAVTANLTTLFAPDAQGRIADVQLDSLRPAGSASDPVERRIYDAAGRLRFVIDARSIVTETRYDGAGRILSSATYAVAMNNAAGIDGLGREARPEDILLLDTAPTGTQIGLQRYGSADRTTRFFYDADGNLVGTLDGEGYLTEYRYDASGRQVQTLRYAAPTAVADRATGTLAKLLSSANGIPAQNITSYAWYNGLGQRVGELDGEGYYTAYQYDRAGNLTRTTRHANRLVGTAVSSTAPSITTVVPGSVPNGGYVLTSAQDQTVQRTWTAFNQIETETSVDGTLTRYAYDSVGNLLSTVSAAGAADSRTLAYRYDKQGRLIQALSAVGAKALAALGASPSSAQIEAIWVAHGVTYSYDAAGRRTRSVDANGNTSLFFYDAANRLTYTVVRVRNPANAAEWVGEVSARIYNALGQVATEIAYANRIAAGKLAGLTGGADTAVKAAGVIVADSSKDTRSDYAYHLTGEHYRTITKLNASESAVSYDFINAFGERYAHRYTVDGARSRQAEFVFDRRGLVTQYRKDVVWTSNPAATAVVEYTTYDAFGRVVSTTDGNGIVAKTTYDKLGRVIQNVGASGSLNLTSKASYDAFGRVLTQTDELNQTTTYGYTIDSASGRTTLSVTSPEGVTTRSVTDRYGQTVIIVDGLGNETRYAYDPDGHLTATTRWDKAANLETTVESNTYDAIGQRLRTTDGTGRVVAYSYDAAGRLLTRTVDPDGLALASTYTYDALGRAVDVKDATGTITRTSYDLAGRAIEVAVDPAGLNLRTQYVYDLAGNTVRLIEGVGTPEVRTTLHAYDSLNRRISTTLDSGGLNLVTTYAYDKNDNLVTRVEAAGTAAQRLTRYSFDADNRLVYTVDALGAVSKADYDAAGRLLQTTAYAKLISLSGLANAPTTAAIAALVTSDTAQDRVTRHVYDKDGRERFSIDATRGVTEQQYDAAGRVIKRIAYANTLQGSLAAGSAPAIVTSAPASGAYILVSSQDRTSAYAYDAAGKLVGVVDALGKAESYAYDAAGRKIGFTNANGDTWRYVYDAAGRLSDEYSPPVPVTRLQWVDGKAQAVTKSESIRTRYTYDGVSNVLTRSEAHGAAEQRTTTYGYDAAGRQTSVTHPAVAVYDAALDTPLSNGIGEGSVSRTESTRVLKTQTVYDALGRATVNRDAGGAYSYKVYDDAGRVVYEIDTARYLTAYTYDALGNRLTTTRYAKELSFASHPQAFSEAEVRGLIVASAEDRTLTSIYDVLGRVVETRQPAVYSHDSSAPSGKQYFTASPTTRTTYNAFGQAIRQSSLKNPLTATWIDSYYYFDARGNKTAEIDALGYLTSYKYDTAGNLVEQVEYAKALTAGSWSTTQPGTPVATTPATVKPAAPASAESEIGFDRITRYAYDALGRKTTETKVGVQYAAPTSGAAANTLYGDLVTRYGYDAVGRLTSSTDATGATTRTYYDALGRTLAVAEPGRTTSGGAVAALPPITVAPQYLDIGPLESVVTGVKTGSEGGYESSTTSRRVDLSWSDLSVWGSGSARVVVNYTNSFGTKTALTRNLSQAEAAHGATVVFETPTSSFIIGGVASVNSVQLQKFINGTWVTVIDSTADTVRDSIMVWERPAVEGTQVVLRYRAQGSTGAWSTATVNTLGERCWVDLSALPADRYEYVLSYTRPGESKAYAEGSGVIAVARGASTNSSNVVAEIVTPYLDIGPLESVVNTITTGESGYEGATASRKVELAWSNLGAWGNEAARVVVDYTYSYITGPKTASLTQNLTAAEAAHGITVALAANTTAITSVKLQKLIGGSWVTVIDGASDVARPAQLVLRGKTAGLSAVEVRDASNTLVGTYSLANGKLKAFAAGVYVVDVSALAAGTYSYKPVGTASLVAGSFVREAGAASRVQVGEKILSLDIGPLESVVTSVTSGSEGGYAGSTSARRLELAWSDLASWGNGDARVVVNYAYPSLLSSNNASLTQTLSAAEAAHGTILTFGSNVTGINSVQVQKYINGAWVTLIDSAADTTSNRLEIAGLPAAAASVQLEYRPKGESGPYVAKPEAVVSKLGTGWFALSYDDIANGEYEYRLTVKDSAGNPLNLSALGGNAQGQVSGVFSVLRGGQGVPSVAAGSVSIVTPLTRFENDIFGNVVHQSSYIKGAAQAGADGYTIAGQDAANDRHAYNVYNLHGHLVQSVDAEGAAVYFSYDAYGRVAKRWQPLTDSIGTIRNAVTLYAYDASGLQRATSEVVDTKTLATSEVKYNAFGEIVAKGLNGVYSEFVDYDNAGRVLRSNSDKGVTTAFLSDLQGLATATIRSATIDLSAAAYKSPSALAALSQNVVRTNTVYDALGRPVKQALPSLTVDQSPDAIIAPLVVGAQYLDIGALESVISEVKTGSEGGYEGATAVKRAELSWSDLGVWGSGATRVIVNYTYQYFLNTTKTASLTQELSAQEAAHGVSVTLGATTTAINSVQLQKFINGTWVTVVDSAADMVRDSILAWERPAVEGTQVVLRYRAQGSTGAWSAATINTLGDRCWVDLSALPANRYEYVLSYTRPGESKAYAEGSGVIAVARGASANSSNVVGEVVTPYLDIGPIETVVSSITTGTEGGYQSAAATQKVAFAWSDLGAWGNGSARVVVNYTYKYGFTTKSATLTQNLSAAEAAHGTLLTFATGITAVSSVQVQKLINGAWVTVIDGTSDVVKPAQLVLRGKTAGLSAVEVRDANNVLVATCSLANGKLKALAGDVFVADITDVQAGNYSYKPVGTASLAGGSFVKEGGSVSGRVQIGEKALTLDIGPLESVVTGITTGSEGGYAGATSVQKLKLSWDDLGAWGSGAARVLVSYKNSAGSTASLTQNLSEAEAAHGTTLTFANQVFLYSVVKVASITSVQVQKYIDGAWVTLINSSADTNSSRLEITALPAAAASVSLEYRVKGEDGPYVSKPASALSKLGTGWFGLSYDDIANGDYEYRLTVKDSAGQLLNLTALGGTAQGLISGVFTVLRGGQSIVGAPAPQLVKLDPVVNRTVDRWGNVLSLSDPAAAGRITNFRYNHANQMISEIKPETDIWNESGVNQRSDGVANDRPTTRYAYDARGGLVATTDANGKINGIRYDEAGQAVSEIHADGGVARTIYDAFGRKTASIDANGKQTSYSYDRADRLTRVRTPLSEDTSYAYDEAGRQIKVTDALGNSTTYDYDTRGNLVRTRQPLGQTSSATYDLQNRKISEIQSGTSETATWRYDYFGRLIDHVDLGGANYDYSYDYSGNLVSQSNNRGQHLVYTYYDNGLIRKINDWANASQTYYEYDAAGRRTRERYRATSGGATATAQDTRIAYDELGRIASVKDTRYAMSYSYDAVGNRRHTVSNYYDPAGAAKTADYWYLYDGMNRIVLSQGVRNASTGKIEIRAEAGSLAAQGTSLAYDAAGNRRTAVFYEGSKQITETYTYDDDNRLKNTHRGGQLTSSRNYDKNGRVTQYTNFSSPGTISDRRVTTYNANGWITSQLNYDAANTLIARVRYDYANSYDSYGNVTYYTVEGLTGTKYTYSYSKTYKKFDSAREDKINGTMAVYYPNGTTTSTGDTTNSYDVNGNLVRVVDRLGTNTTRDFVVNTGGQILKKTEANASEYYFYANGAPVGASGGTAADFDYNYTPVTESYPANSPTNYLVNAGDTLQGIALAVYGDAKLWYLIADANGLTSSNLASYVGKTITIPNRISNVHNDYQTFKPYNPGAIVGDTTPTVPTPPPPPSKDGGCGGAAIIIAIVAVVATVFTAGVASVGFGAGFSTTMGAGMTALGSAVSGLGVAGIASGSLGLAGFAVVGAVGSIASQLTGMALGVQDKFSWGAVAAGALSSAAMAGVVGGWKPTGGVPIDTAINAAARNVVTQGINIITGQQTEFNWSSVAASAVSAPVAAWLGKGFDGKSPMDALARAGVGALTSAVANKAIGGASMSWSSIAADTVSSFMRSDEFGNLLGNAFAADALGNGISLGASRPGLQLNGAGVGYQSVPINDDPQAWQCLAPADGTYTLAGPSRFTAQKGETVWQYAGGDLAKIGAFKRLNGLNDADVIVAGRQYLMPESVSAADVAAGQAQARQWQAKAEAAQLNDFSNSDLREFRRAGVMRSVTFSDAPTTTDNLNEIRGITPWKNVSGLPNTISIVDGMPSQGGYQIVAHLPVVNGEVNQIPAFYVAYNMNAKSVDYVIGQSDLPAFMRASAAYAISADYERAPAYVRSGGDAAIKFATGDYQGGFSDLGKSYAQALQDPGWWLTMATSIAGAVVGVRGPVANNAAAGPVNFMEGTDRFFLNASRRPDIDPNGFFDVIGHGSPNKIQIQTANGSVLVDSRVASRLIEQSPGYNGQNIRLLSCSTGACDTGFAQNLANKLGVEVHAPTDLLWAYPDGRMLVAPRGVNGPDLSNLGSFRVFVPKKP